MTPGHRVSGAEPLGETIRIVRRGSNSERATTAVGTVIRAASFRFGLPLLVLLLFVLAALGLLYLIAALSRAVRVLPGGA